MARETQFALVAQSFEQAPGAPSGVVYGTLSVAPQINNQGKACFLANLGASPTPRAVFAGTPGSVLRVAGTGDPAPGTGAGVVFTTQTGVSAAIRGVSFDHDGNVAFAAGLEGAGVVSGNNSGIWVYDGNGVGAMVAREGQAAPGGPATGVFRDFPISSGVVYLSLSAGALAFYSQLQGTNLAWDQGVWASDGGGTILAVREGQAAVGGGTHTNGFRPWMTRDASAFARLTFQGQSNTLKGVWTGEYSSGAAAQVSGVERLARESAAVNGQPGLQFAMINTIDAASHGIALVEGRVTGGGATGADENRIYIAGPGGLAEAARRANSSAGPFGAPTITSWHGMRVSSAGKVVFHATLEGTGVTADSDLAIGVGTSLGMELIREGDQAPGCAPGVVFRSFHSLAINAEGDIAFGANLVGAGVTSGVNDRGIWATRNGGLELVVRTGEALAFASGPAVISNIAQAAPTEGSSENGLGSCFNDHGQIAFAAGTPGGLWGVFIASPGGPTCAGDFNGDGVVNFTDLNLVLSAFGSTYTFTDLNLVLSNFGQQCV